MDASAEPQQSAQQSAAPAQSKQSAPLAVQQNDDLAWGNIKAACGGISISNLDEVIKKLETAKNANIAQSVSSGVNLAIGAGGLIAGKVMAGKGVDGAGASKSGAAIGNGTGAAGGSTMGLNIA